MTAPSRNMSRIDQTIDDIVFLVEQDGGRTLQNILKRPKFTRKVLDGLLIYGIDCFRAATIVHETQQRAALLRKN